MARKRTLNCARIRQLAKEGVSLFDIEMMVDDAASQRGRDKTQHLRDELNRLMNERWEEDSAYFNTLNMWSQERKTI